MSDFQSLMSEGESTDYGAGEPVPEDEVATIQENLTEVMGDNTLNAQGDNLASENVDKVNVFTRLIKSLNYLIWGDV